MVAYEPSKLQVPVRIRSSAPISKGLGKVASMGISSLENCAIGDEPVRVRFLYLPKLLLVLLIFLTSCATIPTDRCGIENDIRFVILEGYSVEHNSCIDNLVAMSWKTVIEVCENGRWKGTNLWCFWNGCRYKLIQQGEGEKITVVGYFKNFKQMKEFIKITMPMVRKN